MKCYDCDQNGRSDTTPIGVCSRCNLVICPEHGRVTQALVHLVRGTGKSTSDLPARRAVCLTCHAAENVG
ncbi:DUF2180 family protein [Streptomyces iconiensis]|uniref:DUF2180 family protein n=1 Tax=Streptomyces iconiensis TaxID=1384038 RepID=A0ABT6ZZ91_9ACTN|nr:DUF2180 family protein [Streptomyces iconiensis]MDJ1134392.1 DUF2180 family protein [Streptomyces iconiensis]